MVKKNYIILIIFSLKIARFRAFLEYTHPFCLDN